MVCKGKGGWGRPTVKTAVTLEKKMVTKRIKTSHEPGL